jgi:hypothetical protein
MSDFRKLAHLWEQLGEDRFNTLISSDNTGKVKEFCDGLLKSAIPTELMNIGPENRNYDILGFLRDGEDHVVGHTMVERAKAMNANLGEDDGQYLLDNQQDIPVALRGKVVFVFTDWCHPDDSDFVYYVYWSGDQWVRDWNWLGLHWDDLARVLRRK